MGNAIVVGTDGSETAARAVAEAARLAKALGADLHIVSAYEPARGAGVADTGPEGAQAAVERRDHGVESVLSAAAAALDVPASTHAAKGKPVDALLEVADAVGARMIVVGSRGMHGVRRVLGSVPDAVSHRARCDVLIVATD